MARDAHGNSLQIGDTVIIRATVTQMRHEDEKCDINVRLESTHGRRGDGQPKLLWLNSALTEKYGSTDDSTTQS